MSNDLRSAYDIELEGLNDEIELLKSYRRSALKEERKNYKKGLIEKYELNNNIRDIKDSFESELKVLNNIKRRIKRNYKQKDAEITKIIRNFQSTEQKELIFNKPSLDEIKMIINNLHKRYNYNTTIIIDGVYYTLSDSNLKKLREYSFEDKKIEEISDQEFIHTLKTTSKILITQSKKGRSKPAGAFFPYLNTLDIDLSRYGIYNTIEVENYENNCLFEALKLANINETKLNSLKAIMRCKDIPQSDFKRITELLQISICLYYSYNKNENKTYGNYEEIINIGLIEGHYFLIEETKYTSFSIKNYEKLKNKNRWWEFIKIDERGKNSGINSFKLIKLMLELNLFTRITMNTPNILKTQHYNDIDLEITNLNYNEKDLKKTEYKESSTEFEHLFYADFETYKDNTLNLNTAYLCCVVGNNTEKIFRSEKCANELLDFLPDKSLVYYHNLGFDFSFLVKHIRPIRFIPSGSSIKSLSCNYKGKFITFRDSHAFIASALENFSLMFNLDVKKEIMPYNLYSEENINKVYVNFEEALKYVDDNKKEEFKELAKPYIKNNLFSHMDYAIYYCLQDCRTLKAGFEYFRSMSLTEFDLDICNYISLPSFCYSYTKKYGCFENCYELSCIPQLFIQKCIVGGRCMSNNNEKYHTDCIINDFDAVSLYPSAMYRMGFLQGKPKVISKENLNLEYLNQQDGYFIEVSNVKINKNRQFPLQSNTTDNLSRDFSNNITGNLFLDKVSVEDFINYQGASFDIVRGYYFNEGRNYKIQKLIKELFERRLKYKKEKNPTQEVIKLFMNAIYGKTMQKPIETKIKFIRGKEKNERFLNYHFNYIIEYVKIEENYYKYKLKKSINTHFNSVHIGSEILSMSKRIMNEVMCLAEDINCKIYYQDTDSMHIEDADIERLSAEYKKIYNRDLIGKQLGQFHSDFPQEAKAVESYFLGKKSYIDKLLTPTGETIYHIRMKGIPNKCLLSKGEPLEIYKSLYEGNAITFNLSENKFIFKRNKDYSQSINIEFFRTVKF